jgi:amino acid permease
MAVPWLAARVGLLGLLVILPIAWAASALVHLMLAEVAFRTGRELQIVELMRCYVFRGRLGRPLLWAVFGLLALAFLANLAAYVAGAAEIVATLAGVSPPVAQLAVYLLSAGIVLFGLRGVGLAERFGAALLVACVAVLAGGAATAPGATTAAAGPALLVPGATIADWLALYGMVMYAYWTFYSVPQVVAGLGTGPHAQRTAARSIRAGLAVNGLSTGAIGLIALAVSRPVTPMAATSSSPRSSRATGRSRSPWPTSSANGSRSTPGSPGSSRRSHRSFSSGAGRSASSPRSGSRAVRRRSWSR